MLGQSERVNMEESRSMNEDKIIIKMRVEGKTFAAIGKFFGGKSRQAMQKRYAKLRLQEFNYVPDLLDAKAIVMSRLKEISHLKVNVSEGYIDACLDILKSLNLKIKDMTEKKAKQKLNWKDPLAVLVR